MFRMKKRAMGWVACGLLLTPTSCSSTRAVVDAATIDAVRGDGQEADAPGADGALDGPGVDASADTFPAGVGWALAAGGNGQDRGVAVALSKGGETCVGGHFSGTAVFGATTLQGSGGFVGKIDAAGTWLWVVPVTGTSNTVDGVAVDDAGSCHVTGAYGGTVTLGATTLTSPGVDAFVGKLDGAGAWVWAVSSKTASAAMGFGIAVDGAGEVHVTGSFDGPTTFGVTALAPAGGKDIFVARVKDGAWLSAVSAGGAGDDRGNAVAVDGAGAAVVTGQIAGTASFGSTTLTAQGETDLFVARLDGQDAWTWAIAAGSSGADSASAIALDGAGNAVVTGYVVGSAAFGGTTLPTGGLVARVGASGAWLSAVTSGTSSLGVALDGAGTSTVTGYFHSTASFGATTLSSEGFADVYVAALDPAGTWGWAVSAEAGNGQRRGSAVAANASGQVVTTGFFAGTASFGATTLTSSPGSMDIFVWRVK